MRAAADPEHMAVRVAQVYLADAPRRVAGRQRDFQPGGYPWNELGTLVSQRIIHKHKDTFFPKLDRNGSRHRVSLVAAERGSIDSGGRLGLAKNKPDLLAGPRKSVSYCIASTAR